MADKKLTEDVMEKLAGTATVAFCMDTTGSMAPAINDVRKKLCDLVEMLSQDMQSVKVALIAHGDYCDGENCIKVLDFTSDIAKLMNFIQKTPNTSGGDEPECYELALNKARSLSWPAEGGAFIMIGDAFPHDKNPDNLNWREELASLREQNVKVFGMQCLRSNHKNQNNEFWLYLATLSETPLLHLENFEETSLSFGAAAYASAGTDALARYDTIRCKGLSRSATHDMNVDNLKKYAALEDEKKE